MEVDDDNAWLAGLVLEAIGRGLPEEDETREYDLSRLAAASVFAIDRKS